MSADMIGFDAFEAELARLPVHSDGGYAGPRTLVVVPSLTFDRQLLENVKGVDRYEERLLAFLLELRDPDLRIVYCTSAEVPEQIVDYYLQMIATVPLSHSRRRLTMVACGDPSPRPLTAKMLDCRPALQRIRSVLGNPAAAGMACVNTTDLERRLAEELGITLLGNPPDLVGLGSKSGSREIFAAAGIDLPAGRERLRDAEDIAGALADLKAENPGLARAVVKLEEGFSGEGNALFDYAGGATARQIRAALPRRLRFQAARETWESFAGSFAAMGGIVEEFLDDVRASPSGQAYVSPTGLLQPLSTHDQVLGGVGGQVFQGSTFPAASHYRMLVQEQTLAVGEALRDRGGRGRFAVDYVVAQDRVCAIEINLRKGGTTHPMMTLALVTEGTYDRESGEYRSLRGRRKAYYATDNVYSPDYQGMTVDDLFDLAVHEELLYDPETERGAILHMMGALHDFGKVGVTCIADDIESAIGDYRHFLACMDERVRRGERG